MCVTDAKAKGSGGRTSDEAFAAGYNACLEQTRRFLVAQEQNSAQSKGSALASALEVEFRAKLVEHLAEQLAGRGDQQQSPHSPAAKVRRTENTSTSSSSSSSSSEQPNASAQQASPTASSSSNAARQAAAGSGAGVRANTSRAKGAEQKNGAIPSSTTTTSSSPSGSANANGNGVLTGRLPSGELALVLPVGNSVPAVDVGVLGSLSLLASSPLGALLGLGPPPHPTPAQAATASSSASAPRPSPSRPIAAPAPACTASGPTSGFLLPQPFPLLAPATASGPVQPVSAPGPALPAAVPVTAAGGELGLLGALTQLLSLTASASAPPLAVSPAAAAPPPPALKTPTANGTTGSAEGNELLQRLLTLQILGALAGTVSSSNNNSSHIKSENTPQK